jgi:hypothetical protein
MADAWELMAEAERVRQQWRAAEEEYEKAVRDGKPQAELDALLDKKEQLKAAYFHRAKAAVALGSKGK